MNYTHEEALKISQYCIGLIRSHISDAQTAANFAYMKDNVEDSFEYKMLEVYLITGKALCKKFYDNGQISLGDYQMLMAEIVQIERAYGIYIV